MGEDTAEGLKDAIRVDAGQLRGHVDEVVRSSVEETLNALLTESVSAAPTAPNSPNTPVNPPTPRN